MRLVHLGSIGALVLTAGCPGPTAPGGTGLSNGGGAASQQLAFTVSPSNATAGQIITPATQVAARDTLGRTDSAFTANVTITIGTNPVGGRLTGTSTVAAVFGVAVFGDLSIDRTGNGYTLTATATGAAATTSPPFDILSPTGTARVQ